MNMGVPRYAVILIRNTRTLLAMGCFLGPLVYRVLLQDPTWSGSSVRAPRIQMIPPHGTRLQCEDLAFHFLGRNRESSIFYLVLAVCGRSFCIHYFNNFKMLQIGLILGNTLFHSDVIEYF